MTQHGSVSAFREIFIDARPNTTALDTEGIVRAGKIEVGDVQLVNLHATGDITADGDVTADGLVLDGVRMDGAAVTGYVMKATSATTATWQPDLLGAPGTVDIQVMPTIAALRLTLLTVPDVATVSCYSTANDGGGGKFRYIASDVTSADNGGTIIVATGGRRWYRVLENTTIDPRWFGAKADNLTDSAAAIKACLAWVWATYDNGTFFKYRNVNPLLGQPVLSRVVIDFGGGTYRIGIPIEPPQVGGGYVIVRNGYILPTNSFPTNNPVNFTDPPGPGLFTLVAQTNGDPFDNVPAYTGAGNRQQGHILFDSMVLDCNHRADCCISNYNSDNNVVSNCSLIRFKYAGFYNAGDFGGNNMMICHNKIYQFDIGEVYLGDTYDGADTVWKYPTHGIYYGYNDSLAFGNLIYHVNIGIRQVKGGVQIMHNHIWGCQWTIVASPGVMIMGNYLDKAGILVHGMSGVQIVGNYFGPGLETAAIEVEDGTGVISPVVTQCDDSLISSNIFTSTTIAASGVITLSATTGTITATLDNTVTTLPRMASGSLLFQLGGPTGKGYITAASLTTNPKTLTIKVISAFSTTNLLDTTWRIIGGSIVYDPAITFGGNYFMTNNSHAVFGGSPVNRDYGTVGVDYTSFPYKSFFQNNTTSTLISARSGGFDISAGGTALMTLDTTRVALGANVTNPTSGTVLIGSSTIPTIFGGHFVTSGATPTAAAGTGAGNPTSGATITITGNDHAGMITVATGLIPTGGGTIVTVTFSTAFSAAPKAVVISPSNGAANFLSGATRAYAIINNASQWSIIAGSSGLAASISPGYSWYYIVIA
jgi:hypothetical protein